MLAGGSAFGLNAAGGVMRYLEENKMGFHVGPAIVPIVPAAILFDLGVGDQKIRPDEAAGYAALPSSNQVNAQRRQRWCRRRRNRRQNVRHG